MSMFIYNVTTKVSPHIHEDWVRWMKEEHIPAVMQSGCFTEYCFVKLLETDESEGPTYATQYFAATRDDYERYIAQHATALRQDAMDRWGNHFVGFRTLMQIVN